MRILIFAILALSLTVLSGPTGIVKEAFDYHNFARTNPQGMLAVLQKLHDAQPDKNSPYARKIREAMKEVAKQQPLRALVWHDALHRAANDHALDQVRHNAFSHEGSDGSTPSVRVGRYCKQMRFVGENIAAGQRTGTDFVIAWIVSTGHRRNIYNKDYVYLGLGYRNDHPTYKSYMCADFSGRLGAEHDTEEEEERYPEPLEADETAV